MAIIASMALPPSSRMARPSSTAAACGAQTTPRRWPALCRFIASRVDSGREIGQPALLQQRIDRRHFATEGFIGLARVAQIARAGNVMAQTLGGGRIEGVAGF